MSAGTFAYGVAAGVGLGVALVALFIASRHRRPRAFELSLVALGIAACLSATVHTYLQSADTAEEYAAILHGPFAIVGLVTLVVIAWVVALQTRVAWLEAPIALTAGAVAVGVVNFATSGVIVDEVTTLREVSLLGETMVLHEPARATWRIVLDLYLVALTIYVVVALYRRWRTAEPGYAWFVLGIALTYAATLYDSLVDGAVVGTAYLAPFGTVAFALCVAWQLASRLDHLERRLLDQSSQLEALVTVRTRALREANRQVLDELDRQHRVAEQLALLTQHLNDIGVDHPGGGELEHTLASAIENIGRLVGATSVSLELDRASSSAGPVSLRWLDDHEDAHPCSPTATRSLQVDGLELGRLEVSTPGEGLAADRRQLIALSADYLTVALHRRILATELVGRAVDDERRRIARDLHDSVSQRLYAAAFNAEALARSVRNDRTSAAETAERVRGLVLMSLAEMRSLLFEMEPDSLSGSSMSGLIANLCEAMGAAHQRTIEVNTVDGPPVGAEVKLALYRITQEALSNALRHADAASISVTVAVDSAGILLEVADDGSGTASTSGGLGHGLRNMAQRAEEIGAEYSLASQPDAGTTVSVKYTIPRVNEMVLDLSGAADGELAGR